MSRVSWLLIDAVSRLLEPAERQAVQGDILESRQTAARALFEVFGLVLWRQASLWKQWRPWLALTGIVGPIGMLLFDCSRSLSLGYALYSWIIQNYRVIDPTLLGETGLTLQRGIPVLLSRSLALAVWSYTAGFVLGHLSGRTIWVNAPLLCLMWVICGTAGMPRTSIAPVILSSVVLVAPLLLGLRRSLTRPALESREAILLAGATALAAACLIWSYGSWRGGTWPMAEMLTCTILSWPSIYVLSTAISRAKVSTRTP